MKKKILMAVLAASMLAAMPASTVSAQVSVAVNQEAMTGQWYGNYKGIPITMSLQENGDYSVEVGIASLGGEYNDVGTWTVRGDKIILDGNNIKDEFTCTEDKIDCYLDDNKVTLVKNDITAWQGYVPPAPNPDATEADFNGTWKAVYSTNSGYTLETEVTGIVSFCNIDDGIGNFFVHTSNGTNIMTTSKDLKFNAGQMSGSYIDDGEVVEEYTLSLLEDGRLFVKIVYNDGNDESDMYMEKTTAEDMEETMEEVANESNDTSADDDTTEAETTELSGTWQGAMNDGSDGTLVTLALNSDGEYTLSLDEIQEAGKWSESDNVVTLESGFLKREFVFDGTTLTNEDDKITLAKIDDDGDMTVPESDYTPAAETKEITNADVEGSWKAEYIEYSGFVIPIEYSSSDIYLNYADGKIKMYSPTDEDMNIQNVSTKIDGNKMLFNYPKAEGDDTAVSIAKLEDNMLKMDVSEGDENASVYFAQIPDDEFAEAKQ